MSTTFKQHRMYLGFCSCVQGLLAGVLMALCGVVTLQWCIHGLFAGVQVANTLAAATADVAAPDELAMAALNLPHQVSIVTTATAQ